MSEDIAWAAGLFEGEGSMTPCKSQTPGRTKVYYYPSLSVGTTDRDVLEKFVNIVGRGRVCGPYRLGPSTAGPRKPLYQWKIGGAGAREVIKKFLPYLGERRTARAREVFGDIA